MKKPQKIILTLFCIAAAAVMLLAAVSHGVYHRSIMASLAEFYMVLIDRDKIYSDCDAYYENLTLRETENLQDYEKPESVKVSVPCYDKKEHSMQVYYFNEEAFTDTIIIYIPGGAYLNNPLKYHWKIIDNLSSKTNTPVLMPVYLKVPNYTCDEAYKAMKEFYLDVSSRENVKRIILIGDSSGGGMSLVLSQIIRDEHPEALQPDDLILIAPWMDVSMDNEDIPAYEPVDPMLDIFGAVEIGKKWAGERDVHDPMVSPIYGEFQDLGYITMFIGTRDMLCPDILKFSEILNEQKIEHTLVVEEGLDHPYPLFPTPEAKKAQELMIEVITKP